MADEAMNHQRPLDVVVAEFFDTFARHVQARGRPPSYTVWVQAFMQHLLREGHTMRKILKREREEVRLLRVMRSKDVMAERIRDAWVKAGTAALMGNPKALEALINNAQAGNVMAFDQIDMIMAALRDSRPRYSMRDLHTLVTELMVPEPAEGDEDQSILAVHQQLAQLLDELAIREERGEILI